MRLTSGTVAIPAADSPPILAQVEDLLVLVPDHAGVRAGVGHFQTTGERVDIGFRGEDVLGNHRNAGVELQAQNLKLEARRGLAEGDHRSLVIHGLNIRHECSEIGVVGQFVVRQLTLASVRPHPSM